MISPVPTGKFESVYTMKTETGEIDLIDDQIEFVITDGTQGNESVGRGRVDNDGLEMRLTLRNEGLSIQGTWEEYDRADQRIHGGTVAFAAEGEDKLVGMWQAEASDEAKESETAYGTWKLTKVLGNTALR